MGKMQKVGFVLVLLILFATSSVHAQQEGDCYYIKNDYIQAGLSSYGTYGATSSAKPAGYYSPANSSGILGFICSPDASWSFFYGDFVIPGSPYEGFSVTYTNTSTGQVKTKINDRSGSAAIANRTPNFTYHGTNYDEITWHGTVAGEFDIDCHFKMEGPRIIHSTTITNTSSVKYTNVYFARGLDPDQENGGLPPNADPGCYATTNTYNVIQSQANGTPGKVSWVTANGYCAPSSISLYSEDPNSRVGISSSWKAFLNNPPLAWEPSTGGNYTQEEEYSRTVGLDWSIEIAILVGDLNPGESKTVQHEIRLDQPPVVRFLTSGLDASRTLTKNEGETFTYTLQREYQLDEVVNVELTLSSVTGITAADFEDVASLPKTYNMVFDTGETTKTISIAAAYDAVTDDNEKFKLEITSVTSPVGGLATSPGDVYGIIRDVPLPVATIGGCSTVNEGSNCTVTVSLSKLPIADIGPAILDLDFSGDATFGMGNDYTITPLTNMVHVSGSTYRITIPLGQTTATFRLDALTDNVYEPNNETVVPTLTPVSGTVSTSPTTTITIADLTVKPVLNINAVNTVSANEGDMLTYTITITGSTCSENITVLCTTIDNTAVEPGDYVAKSETVTFLPGETSKTFTVQTNTDKLMEGDELLYVSLSNPVNAALQGGGSVLQTNGKIVDQTDGTLVVVKQTPAGSASENPLTHGSFRIKFKDDQVKTSPDRNVKVDYTLGGTSVISRDHTVSPTPVGEATILANSSYVDVIISVVDNYLVQGNHNVEITITNATLQ